ncbi:MAG: helix-turn-helix domain-containing protein, partial [Sedimentisphaerales bacterium]|nr:helix-turn-helix domain-containing protein [Sedimentisphaerales bacterium]
MFYSLEEAAEKLNKSQDEVKKLVKDGQIREFRDGPNILFKAEEVEALIPAKDVSGPSKTEEPIEIKDETEIIEMASEETEPEIGTEEMEIPELTPEEPEPEVVEEEMEIPKLTPEETTEEVV